MQKSTRTRNQNRLDKPHANNKSDIQLKPEMATKGNKPPFLKEGKAPLCFAELEADLPSLSEEELEEINAFSKRLLKVKFVDFITLWLQWFLMDVLEENDKKSCGTKIKVASDSKLKPLQTGGKPDFKKLLKTKKCSGSIHKP